jgi:DNA-binding CsgD family transcriptional regulator
MDREHLRPVERAVLRLRDGGVPIDEIAARFRRSPGHIERVIGYTEMARTRGRRIEGLRPLERRVLAMAARGVGFEQMAAAFRRSPEHMKRVTGLAHLRRAKELLSGPVA